MYNETNLAVKTLLQSISWDAAHTPKLFFDIADPMIEPNTPEDFEEASISCLKIREELDLSRFRDGNLILHRYDNGSLDVVTYPKPFSFIYQIDLRSAPYNPYQMNSIKEHFLRAVGIGRHITARWTIGGYSVAASLLYRLAEPPELLDNESFEGRSRMAYRYTVNTWLFEETTPRESYVINYRLFDVQIRNQDNFDIQNLDIVKTANPDGYSG